MIIIFLLVYSCDLQAQTSSAKWKAMEAEGDTLLNIQDFTGAIKIYNKVVELSKLKDTESKGVLYNRAICFYSTGEFQKALDDLNAFILEYPSVPRAKLLRAFINKELGDTKSQLADINELLLLSPSNPDLLIFKANIFLENEEYKEAKQELLMLQKLTNNEEIETQLGFIYANLNEPDSAFIHLDAALTINGGYSPAYMYISSLCLEQEAYSMALTYIDLGLRLDPENQQLLFFKGISLAESENLQDGCRLLSKVFYAGMDQAADYLKQYCYNAKD